MLRSKRLRNEDVPPSPGLGRVSNMTPFRESFTPLVKRPRKYELGEHKEPLEVFLRIRPLAEGQKSVAAEATTTSVAVPTKVPRPPRTRLLEEGRALALSGHRIAPSR